MLITNPRDFPRFVAELRKHKFFFISGVNTLFNALLHTPGFESIDFSALKITLGGGMAVQAVVAERWKEVTGNVLTQAWGLTETSPAACINPHEPGLQRLDRPADPLHRDLDPGRRRHGDGAPMRWARSACAARR